MNGTVGKGQNSVITEAFVGQNHKKHPGDHLDSGEGFDILKSRAQYIAGGIHGSGHFSVRISRFDHQGAQVQRVQNQFFGLFPGEALGLAQLQHQGHISLLAGMVHWVHQRGPAQVGQSQGGCFGANFLRRPDQAEPGDFFGQNDVCGTQGSLFKAFGQHDVTVGLFCL